MKNTVGLKTVTNQKQDKKLWIKTSKGEFTAMNLVKIEQNDNSYYTYYKAELHNDTQMTVADLKNQMGGYVGDSSQAVFDDIEEGKNIDFFSEKRALPAEIEAQEALIEIEKIIKEKAEKGSTSVIIREQPYSDYLMYSSDNPVSKIVVDTLRKNGFDVDLFYYEGQFVDYGLRIEWSQVK